ncbi:15220_t:CDS:1 [Acaulospora colombiana]|uniref:15220_t:CDS:1 n=1 Tax=Acaulospora colombiana TaxID=27376 RepID=A0ACA9MXZ4_9GLOM|nr:15220_t:CDS:1 [Acaulospora colombiana]
MDDNSTSLRVALDALSIPQDGFSVFKRLQFALPRDITGLLKIDEGLIHADLWKALTDFERREWEVVAEELVATCQILDPKGNSTRNMVAKQAWFNKANKNLRKRIYPYSTSRTFRLYTGLKEPRCQFRTKPPPKQNEEMLERYVGSPSTIL